MEERSKSQKKEEFHGDERQGTPSPDLRCFWDKCEVEGDFQQEYGRTMVFSNLLARKKVTRMTSQRSLQA